MGGLRGEGDWEYAQGSYCSFITVKYFAMEKEQGKKGRKATLLCHLDSDRAQTPTVLSASLTIGALCSKGFGCLSSL